MDPKFYKKGSRGPPKFENLDTSLGFKSRTNQAETYKQSPIVQVSNHAPIKQFCFFAVEI